ncbi:MAG: FGGY-family carbohydrate kinase, partial [Candidatus Acidiferrales bacterium]
KIPAQSIRLGGGGARSELWRQIQADIYGMSVEIVEAEEGPAFGAALLAGVGAGVWPSVEDACDKSVRVARRVAPDAATANKMKLRYGAYRQLYPALRGIFHELQEA